MIRINCSLFKSGLNVVMQQIPQRMFELLDVSSTKLITNKNVFFEVRNATKCIAQVCFKQIKAYLSEASTSSCNEIYRTAVIQTRFKPIQVRHQLRYATKYIAQL